MENSYYNHANRAYFLCKSYLFVKFFVIFLFIANVTLANGNGTSELYDIKKGTLLEYFKDIEKETGYVFIYSKDIRPSLNQVVSVDLSRKKTITEKLSALFEKTNLVYEINGKQIVVKRKTAVKKNLSSQPQEPRRITGTITDTKGEPIIGANIKEVGTFNGIISDINGRFALSVNPNAILEISYIGYVTTTVPVKDNKVLSIEIEEAEQSLEEVVVVGYGKQKKESVTASIASISRKELVQTQQSNISNMLVGRMPGLIAFQRSGAPGEDASSLLIRGVSTFTDNTAPLIMIDGIERTNFDGIDPNEVESLNILKDASATAIYGVKGANGVVLITTRKGERGRPRLSYSGNFALQQSTQLPSYLNSADYATLYNEALENDSRVSGSTYQPKFTDKDIELYRNGFDPILHPNTNWIDDFLRKFSTRTQHNINLSGGTERVKYFISGSYFDQTGIYKHTKIDSDHDVNPRNTRYNFRTNFDFQITRDFSATVQMAAQIGRVITPGSGNSGIWQAISFANPLSSPGLVDNKIVRIQDGLGSVNPWQTLLSNGYQKDNRNNINTTLRLNYDLSSLLTKGLSVHGSIAYDSYYYSRKKYSKTFPYYLARRDAEDPDYIYLIPQSEESIWSVSTGWDKNRKVYMEFGIDYNRTFGLHKTTALILYNQSKYYSPSLQYYVPNAYQGLVGRLTYEYASRYLAEFNMGYNGTENFAKGKRFGFFPAVSLGWVISEEKFFPKNNIVKYLKVRGSYGEVGNDQIGGDRFLYLPSSYGAASDSGVNKYNFGLASNPYTSLMIVENKIGNPDLTWEKAKKMNVGVDINLFNNCLTASFDIFKEKRNNILANRSTSPMIIGANLPAYNFGEMENRGWEMDLNFRHHIQDFHYWARFNYSFARNEIIYMDEVQKRYDYQMTTGRRKNQFFGLIFDGYYNSWEEINALDRPKSSWSGNQLQPGDVKYIDVNQDGVIDDYDMVPIGYTPVPEIIYGFSFGAQYKGFDFSILFQGADNVSIKYFGRSMWPFAKGEESAKSLIKERWTQERYEAGEKITFPRLSLNPNGETDHNYRPSTLWIRDASYLRLKNLEVGYTFTGGFVKRLNLNSVRLYFNGSNLFTWTDVVDLDPEAPSRSGNVEINTYPLQKVYNIGLNINF